jgi:drug/metabolite transporter (DMT)-like permease
MTLRAPALNVAAGLGVIYLVWGSTYLGIRLAISTMPPLMMSSIRFLVAGALLYVVAIRRGDVTGDRPDRRQWLSSLVIGALLLGGGNGGVAWAEQFIPSGVAALLVSTSPIWMVLLGRLMFGDRVRWPVIVGVPLGLAGIAILAHPSGLQPWQAFGTLAVLGGSLAWAVGSLLPRRLPLPKRALVGSAMEMMSGGLVLGAGSLATGELGRVQLQHFSTSSTLALLYLVVFGSLVAFTVYGWLLRVAPTSLVSTYAYVNPAVAVGLGWLIAGEAITAATLLGAAVIVTAVALIVSGHAIGRKTPAARSQPGAPEPARLR